MIRGNIEPIGNVPVRRRIKIGPCELPRPQSEPETTAQICQRLMRHHVGEQIWKFVVEASR